MINIRVMNRAMFPNYSITSIAHVCFLKGSQTFGRYLPIGSNHKQYQKPNTKLEAEIQTDQFFVGHPV